MHRSIGGPGNELMLGRILQHLAANPELTKTVIQREFDRHRYQLIYTPPYNSATQPIEMVWGIVKGYVRRQFTGSRTMEQLRHQTRQGFYNVLTLEQIQGCIEHVKNYCTAYIQQNIDEARDILSIEDDVNDDRREENDEVDDELDDINEEEDDADDDDVQ
jgi:transposase